MEVIAFCVNARRHRFVVYSRVGLSVTSCVLQSADDTMALNYVHPIWFTSLL